MINCEDVTEQKIQESWRKGGQLTLLKFKPRYKDVRAEAFQIGWGIKFAVSPNVARVLGFGGDVKVGDVGYQFPYLNIAWPRADGYVELSILPIDLRYFYADLHQEVAINDEQAVVNDIKARLKQIVSEMPREHE